MIQMFLVFCIVFAIVFFGIQTFRQLRKKEKWLVIKTLTYSAICAIISVVVLISIVILF